MYYALVDSLLSYGLASYGRTFKTYLDKIKALQIRFMKLMVDKKTKIKCKSSNYEQLFLECKMLPVHEKVVLTLALEQLCNDEFKNVVSNQRLTRNRDADMLQVPSYKNYYGKRCRKYLIPKIYNDLPSDVKNKCITKKLFKKQVSHFLISKLKIAIQ